MNETNKLWPTDEDGNDCETALTIATATRVPRWRVFNAIKSLNRSNPHYLKPLGAIGGQKFYTRRQGDRIRKEVLRQMLVGRGGDRVRGYLGPAELKEYDGVTTTILRRGKLQNVAAARRRSAEREMSISKPNPRPSDRRLRRKSQERAGIDMHLARCKGWVSASGTCPDGSEARGTRMVLGRVSYHLCPDRIRGQQVRILPLPVGRS